MLETSKEGLVLSSQRHIVDALVDADPKCVRALKALEPLHEGSMLAAAATAVEGAAQVVEGAPPAADAEKKRKKGDKTKAHRSHDALFQLRLLVLLDKCVRERNTGAQARLQRLPELTAEALANRIYKMGSKTSEVPLKDALVQLLSNLHFKTRRDTPSAWRAINDSRLRCALCPRPPRTRCLFARRAA